MLHKKSFYIIKYIINIHIYWYVFLLKKRIHPITIIGKYFELSKYFSMKFAYSIFTVLNN